MVVLPFLSKLDLRTVDADDPDDDVAADDEMNLEQPNLEESGKEWNPTNGERHWPSIEDGKIL